MKVRLLTHTPEPEMVVAAAAKLCYASVSIDELLDGLTEEKSREFVTMLATMGHESPTEHASFTFAVEGMSRSLMAQITRHRIASFSVQSQRYVRLEGFDKVLPPEIGNIPEAATLYDEAMQYDAEVYSKMTAILEDKHMTAFLEQGLSEKAARQKAGKKAIEDARFLLPNACTTSMILTMNARSLNHFFRLRCCNRAQWEIHELADEMLKTVCGAAPALFAAAGPGCAAGGCTEGGMSCGLAAETKAKYVALRIGGGNTDG